MEWEQERILEGRGLTLDTGLKGGPQSQIREMAATEPLVQQAVAWWFQDLSVRYQHGVIRIGEKWTYYVGTGVTS